MDTSSRHSFPTQPRKQSPRDEKITELIECTGRRFADSSQHKQNYYDYKTLNNRLGALLIISLIAYTVISVCVLFSTFEIVMNF